MPQNISKSVAVSGDVTLVTLHGPLEILAEISSIGCVSSAIKCNEEEQLLGEPLLLPGRLPSSTLSTHLTSDIPWKSLRSRGKKTTTTGSYWPDVTTNVCRAKYFKFRP